MSTYNMTVVGSRWRLFSFIMLLYSVQSFTTTTKPIFTGTPSKGSSFGIVGNTALQVASLPTEGEAKGAAEEEQVNGAVNGAVEGPFPKLGRTGIYHIQNKEEHQAFLAANRDKLIIMKVFAPWCRACKGLAPKFQKLVDDKKYKKLPIVWCELSIADNKQFVKSLGVLALPSVQFYVNGQIADNFPCGPSKVPILKRKLVQLVNTNVDAKTLKVKESLLVDVIPQTPPPTVNETEISAGTATAAEKSGSGDAQQQQPTKAAEASSEKDDSKSQQQKLTDEEIKLVKAVPFFKDFTDVEFDSLIAKGSTFSFQSGSVIMREGKRGSTFYVILGGEVEICQRTGVEDVLTTPASYLGTVINRLETGDFFGERGLITGEPRAASIRVTEEATRCIGWNRIDIPTSCILRTGAGATSNANAAVTDVDYNEKYGVELGTMNDIAVGKKISESLIANQVRGSAINPNTIKGVDTNDDIDVIINTEDLDEITNTRFGKREKTKGVASGEALISSSTGTGGEDILALLQRLRLIRLVSRCFDYIKTSKIQWGDPAVQRRRSMLVSRLSDTQKAEFTEAFKLVDESDDGYISLIELQKVMASVGDEKTEEQLVDMVSATGHVMDDDNNIHSKEINYEEFLGIMAETEFYNLFHDVFSSLDKYDSGFVRAKDLDRVLCGVRDLISDDRKSIIDVEDSEMQIDYETFSKMLLGMRLE